jgi:biotin operon repressor
MSAKNRLLEILEDNAIIDDALHEIVRTRVSRRALMRQLMLSDRRVRGLVEDLRNEGYKICSDSRHAGYYLGTSQEWNDFCDRERSAGLARMHRKTTEYDKQLVIIAEKKEVEK